MKYFVIKITRVVDHAWPGSYLGKAGDFWYHSGGRGNGAFANMYEEGQVNRILGQYKKCDDLVAKAIEVKFAEGEE